MCRLFGLSGAPHRIRATFWLLDAQDSLATQSRREPDGVGLGVFDELGRPVVHKQPIAAYEDRAYAHEARELASTTFVAHIRYATTGGLAPDNTHPFVQDGRLFAHNGVVEGLDRLDAELGPLRDELVRGETDSERIFALITARARRSGDLGEAIVDAVGWVARHLPVFAINLVLTTATELWALRYPDVHPLYLLRRAAGGPAAVATWTMPAPPVPFGCAPATSRQRRRWWWPPSGWTRTPAGARYGPASSSGSAPTSA